MADRKTTRAAEADSASRKAEANEENAASANTEDKVSSKKSPKDEGKVAPPTPTQEELDAKRENRYGRTTVAGAAGTYETR